MYYDDNGLIVQKDGDGGDTAGREGDYWASKGFHSYGYHVFINDRKLTFADVMSKLQIRHGIFVRNPGSYNDEFDFSKDQQTALVIAMGEQGDRRLLWRTLWEHLKRFGAYQNFSTKWSDTAPSHEYTKVIWKIWVKGDYAGPAEWDYYIRSLDAWYLYPVLFIGDTFLLTNSVIRCIVGKDRNNVSDDINHTLSLLQAQNHLATPISWLARKVYKWFRPLGGIQGAWDWYFRPETNANPFNEIYRPLIERM